MTSTPDSFSAESIACVDLAITSRRSVRAFLPKPVPQVLVEEILAVARQAPSGTNIQPWQVHVLTGAPKQALSADILSVFNEPEQALQHVADYEYYPVKWVAPYVDRRRKVGWDMYGLLNIGKADKQAMHDQHARNYSFFDAPIGLMFTIDRILQQGSWLDYGMFLQNVMVAARARGLDTCPQVAFSQFHRIIAKHLGLEENQQVVCGMSLGYADPQALVNRLTTDREPVAAFTRFHGF
jgi:nitroreductase